MPEHLNQIRERLRERIREQTNVTNITSVAYTDNSSEDTEDSQDTTDSTAGETIGIENGDLTREPPQFDPDEIHNPFVSSEPAFEVEVNAEEIIVGMEASGPEQKTLTADD